MPVMSMPDSRDAMASPGSLVRAPHSDQCNFPRRLPQDFLESRRSGTKVLFRVVIIVNNRNARCDVCRMARSRQERDSR